MRDRQLPAFFLAVLVHIVLGLILVYGFRWDIPPPKPAVLELWSPPPRPAAVDVEPPAVAVTPKPVTEPELPRAEINRKLQERVRPVKEKPAEDQQAPPQKKPKALPKLAPKKPPHKPVVKPVTPKVPVDPLDALSQALSTPKTEKSPEANKPAPQSNDAGDSDIKSLVESYSKKFEAEIRKNYHVIPGTPKGLTAEVRITVLSDGTLDSPQITESSGNAAYDLALVNAVKMTRKAPTPPNRLPYSEIRDTKITFRF